MVRLIDTGRLAGRIRGLRAVYVCARRGRLKLIRYVKLETGRDEKEIWRKAK